MQKSSVDHKKRGENNAYGSVRWYSGRAPKASRSLLSLSTCKQQHRDSDDDDGLSLQNSYTGYF